MKQITLYSLFFFAVIACENMETVVEIELPPVNKELVLECYLEPGQPYRLLLTETKDFFGNLDECPFVRAATVVVSHNGQKDTLEEAAFFNNNCDPNDILPYGFIPFLNQDSTRFYNYGSAQLCPLDYSAPFTLEVWDSSGRYAIATTQLIPPSPIANFRVDSNSNGIYYALLSTMDDLATEDYYRLLLHKTSLTKRTNSSPLPQNRRPKFDRTIDDAGIFAGKEVTAASNYRFESGDTLIGSVYHISKAYHDYLESIDDAQSANNSPFGQPALVISNVIGGRGVFAFLSYDRDTIYIP
jgi:hypothetical protein